MTCPFKVGDKVVASGKYKGMALRPGKVYTVQKVQRLRVTIEGRYESGELPISGLGFSCFRAAVAGVDYPLPPNDLYPSGHLADGSSVQKHSAGELYPYVVAYRDSTDPHSSRNYDVGLIGPRVVGTAWFTSFDDAVAAAMALKK